MRRLIVTVILLASVSGCHDGSIPLGGDIGITPSTITSRFSSTSTGSITGRVHWAGAVPTVADIAVERIMADGIKIEHVTRSNPHAPQVDATGGVGGAVVFLRGIDPTLARPWDLPPVAIDMRDDGPIVRQGNNSPSLVGFVHRGDEMTMVSKQTRYQMVRARGAAFFTLSLPDPDQPRTRPLTEVGRVEITSASGDTAVRGHVFVDDHPYYTMTESNGRFEIPQVPAGDYQLVCWQPNWRIERQERDPETLMRVRLLFQAALENNKPVTVRSGEITNVTFEVGAEENDVMATDVRLKDELGSITEHLVATYEANGRAHHLGHLPLPSREPVDEILADLCDVLYPGFARRQNLHLGNVGFYVGSIIDGLHDKLTQQIARALRHDHEDASPQVDFESLAQQKTMAFLRKLPTIRSVLEEDVRAAYEGDPAARNHFEVVFCYPGLEAVTTYRLAHELLGLGVPLIPRMMTEAAHSKTGIDIHPGATIGPGFFIDHGTGVVIGETCLIGRNVKLYQGVTLGALSFPRDAQGQIIRGTKRHPTLENEVVVYANATILGGDTIVGHHAVIGSNVWLTHSVPPYTHVVLEKPQLRMRSGGDESGEGLMYHI